MLLAIWELREVNGKYGNSRFRVQGGIGRMENQMEKNMENEMGSGIHG